MNPKPYRAKQRLSAGRARDHPVMEIVPNKALSLSLSLLGDLWISLHENTEMVLGWRTSSDFWTVPFPDF